MKKIGLLLIIFSLCLGCLGLVLFDKVYVGNLNLIIWFLVLILVVEFRIVNNVDKKLGEIGEKFDFNNSFL